MVHGADLPLIWLGDIMKLHDIQSIDLANATGAVGFKSSAVEMAGRAFKSIEAMAERFERAHKALWAWSAAPDSDQRDRK